MKFQGYGIVWDNENNKILVDFESGVNNPGIIETNDKTICEKLIKAGFMPIIELAETEQKLLETISELKNTKAELQETNSEEKKTIKTEEKKAVKKTTKKK